MAKGLTRSEILAAADLDLKPVDCPEWGGVVYVRSMSGKERLEWEAHIRRMVVEARGGGDVSEAELAEAMNSEGVAYDLFVRTVCDESGALLFTVDDVPELERKSWTALERCMAAAAQASGISMGDGSPPAMVDDLGK